MPYPLATLPMDEVAALYAAGQSAHALARRYGVRDATIRTRLAKHGVALRSLSKAQCLPPNKGRRISENQKARLSKIMNGVGKGTPKPYGFGERVAAKLRGRAFSDESRKKMSQNAACRGVYGKAHRSWRGGHSSFVRALVQTSIYKDWRLAIYQRDKYTCQRCGQVGGKLNAHHIRKLVVILRENGVASLDNAELCVELWDVSNGKTLCKSCHKIEED